MFTQRSHRHLLMFSCTLVLSAATGSAAGQVLTTESFTLPYGPGNTAAAPYMDEVANTSSGLGTWGERGAIGLQGSQSIYPNGSGGYMYQPPSVVAFNFNVGATIDQLNSTYGPGNWSIASPAITMQYTYYANNNVFAGGAGSFETYVVQNHSWYFGNTGASGPGLFSGYTAGEDPIYATTAAQLATWSGGQADLGSTYYNWLSPPGGALLAGATAFNPNYAGWATDKTGLNQGLLTDTLLNAPLLVSDLTSASATGNPWASFYLIPNDQTLGLCIFTGGGESEPTLSFDVVSAPEPASLGLMGLSAMGLLLQRKRLENPRRERRPAVLLTK